MPLEGPTRTEQYPLTRLVGRPANAYSAIGVLGGCWLWRQHDGPATDNARSAGCDGDVDDHDEGGVTVQGNPGPVVAHGGAQVGVRGRLLHVAQRDPGIEDGGDEDRPGAAFADGLVHGTGGVQREGLAGRPAHDGTFGSPRPSAPDHG